MGYSETWAFLTECPIPDDIEETLITGERALCAYKTLFGISVLTDKRLILRGADGLAGKNIQIRTLPYSSIIMYSIKNANRFMAASAEIELWTQAGVTTIGVPKGIDVYALDKLLASYVLD